MFLNTKTVHAMNLMNKILLFYMKILNFTKNLNFNKKLKIKLHVQKEDKKKKPRHFSGSRRLSSSARHSRGGG